MVDWLIYLLREGDKENHTPVLHVPQLYYFIAAATFFGWPVLISGPGGAEAVANGVRGRMFGSKSYVIFGTGRNECSDFLSTGVYLLQLSSAGSCV